MIQPECNLFWDRVCSLCTVGICTQVDFHDLFKMSDSSSAPSPSELQQGSASSRRLLNNPEVLEDEDDDLLADLLKAVHSEDADFGGRHLLQNAIPYQVTLFSQNGDFGDAISTNGVSEALLSEAGFVPACACSFSLADKALQSVCSRNCACKVCCVTGILLQSKSRRWLCVESYA